MAPEEEASTRSSADIYHHAKHWVKLALGAPNDQNSCDQRISDINQLKVDVASPVPDGVARGLQAATVAYDELHSRAFGLVESYVFRRAIADASDPTL